MPVNLFKPNQKTYYPNPLTLVIGVIATLAATITVHYQEISIAKYEFTKRSSDATRTVHELLANSINATAYLAAFIDSIDNIERDRFNTYATKVIDNHQVIQALEWIPRVEANELPEFEETNKKQIPDFTVTERNELGKIIPVLYRPVYFPVQFVTPVIGNKPAIGFDISSNKTRKEMLIIAAQRNKLTASSRVRLVQEKENSFGILVTMPVFEHSNLSILPLETNTSLKGYALGVYRINGIIENSLLKGSYIPTSFSIIDESSQPDENLLYKLNTNTHPEDNWFSFIDKFDIAGRTYSIHISEKPEVFLSQFRTSTFILLAGLLITAITSIYVSIMRTRNTELYQSNQDLKKAIDDIKSLQGIIPICSYCHSIRDDEGAWNQLESYISRNSQAKFSHGICPKCVAQVRAETGLESDTK